MNETGAPATTVPGESPTAPALSQVERVVDTFVAPSKTFTDILRSQSWWLPFLLTVIVTYGYVFALQSRVGWDNVAANAIKQDPKAVERMATSSAEQQAQIQKITVASIQYGMYAAPILVLLFTAVIALVLWGTINFLFGGRATFGQVFAVWMYGTLPLLIVSILTIITLFAGLDREAFNINNPVGTNIGFYLSAETPQWLQKLATSLDLLMIWSLILSGIGLAIVAKVKRSAGLTAVFGWGVLIVIIKVAYAAFTG